MGPPPSDRGVYFFVEGVISCYGDAEISGDGADNVFRGDYKIVCVNGKNYKNEGVDSNDQETRT